MYFSSYAKSRVLKCCATASKRPQTSYAGKRRFKNYRAQRCVFSRVVTIGSTRSKHVLPDLPYDYGALEPHISAEIMQIHHVSKSKNLPSLPLAVPKYFRTPIVEKIIFLFCATFGQTKVLFSAKASRDLRQQSEPGRGKGARGAQQGRHKDGHQPAGLLFVQCNKYRNVHWRYKSALKFNGGGHINHSIFWTNLGKEGGEPKGALLEAIKRDFGGLDKLKERMNTSAAGVQGSGWAWLGYDKTNRRLQLATCANQDPLEPTTGM